MAINKGKGKAVGKGKARAHTPLSTDNSPTVSPSPHLVHSATLFSSETLSLSKRKRVEDDDDVNADVNADADERIARFLASRKETTVNYRPKSKTHLPIHDINQRRRPSNSLPPPPPRRRRSDTPPTEGFYAKDKHLEDSDDEGAHLLAPIIKRQKVCA